jgi:putative phosphoesterase
MTAPPSIIGLISDTHGLLRDRALDALRGCGLIVHAGDIGAPEILDRLRALAPVTAVRGNIDTAPWAEALPETAETAWNGARLYVLHDVQTLAPTGPPPTTDIVVSGHSHRPSEQPRGGVLYINPGSAGPRRFKPPITLARLDVSVRPYRIEFVPVG